MSSFLEVKHSPPDRDGRAVDRVGDDSYEVRFRAGQVEVDGPARATLHAAWPIPLAKVKRGLQAEVEGIGVVLLFRPRFGLRRSARPILIQGPDLRWRTNFQSLRRYQILIEDGEVVMRRHHGANQISSRLSSPEVALVIAILRSEDIDTSALTSYVTL